MRIEIAWKSSLAIKKLKIRREKKQEGKEAAWQWAPHAQTMGIWDGTAVVLEGFCCLGAFLMNKLHPPEWSLPFPSHCLCTVICFSLIPSHCCIWDSAYWCEKKKKKPSHVIDKSRDNCRGQGTAERQESRGQSSSQLRLHPHSPRLCRRAALHGPEWLIGRISPRALAGGRKEGNNLTAFPRYLISVILICALFEASPIYIFFCCCSSAVGCVFS